MSSQYYFQNEYMEVLKHDYPQLSKEELGKIINYKWSILSKIKRDPFDLAAKHDQKRFDKEKRFSDAKQNFKRSKFFQFSYDLSNKA